LDWYGNDVFHWKAYNKDSISSGGAVVSLQGSYTIWIAVENSDGAFIGEQDNFSDGCPRLSGDDSISEYKGYLQVELDVSPPPSATSDGSSIASSLTQTTRFVLASGENKRLRLLSIAGASSFSSALITKASISDWSTTEQVRLRVPGQPPLLLTSTDPTATLSEPVWLHQLDVQVSSSERGTSLPEVELEYVLSGESIPQFPGQHFPFTWQQLDTFLTSANSLLSVSSWLPEDSDTTLQALAVRMVIVEEGQSWLHVDARGDGSMLRLPINKTPDGFWRFNTQGDNLTLKGSAQIGANGGLSLTIEEGSVGGLVLEETTLELGAN
jgi:hypothetical protein